MPPKRRPQPSEPRQGLVITLVFFILATIGLGVGTYYGFADQDAKDKAKKDAEAKLKTANEALEYYKFQAEYYRTVMGHPDNIAPDELAASKDKFDKGSLGAKEKDFETVKKLIGDKLGKGATAWNAALKKPNTTYEQLVEKAKNEYEALLKEKDREADQRKAAEKARKEAESQLADAEKTFKEELVKVRNSAKGDLEKEKVDLKDLQDRVAKLGEEKEAALKTADDMVKKSGFEVKKLQAKVKELQVALEARNQEIQSIKLAKNEAPATARTDWKIVRLDRKGVLPYINMGSADRVRPQLTFSIHGLGLDRRPIAASKGTLEVVTVLGDHLSQTRITSVKDPDRDPILEGDVLFNPLWNPTLKKHVAVAGMVDLTTGKDPEAGLQDFLRTLERQDVIVDAWIDSRDFTIKGPGVTVQTDFLILAETADFFSDGRERSPEVAKKLDEAIKKMKDTAKENGVAFIPLRKYLEMIGYRIPPHMAEPTGISPLYKPRPDQLPPPPVIRQPPEKDRPPPDKDKPEPKPEK